MLTVNETKTHVCHSSDESFDFLGYTFGRCYSAKTRRAYTAAYPSRKKVHTLTDQISELTGREWAFLWAAD